MTQYSFFTGEFTEYATFYIYASDIFLILTLFFWILFDKNIKSDILTNFRRLTNMLFNLKDLVLNSGSGLILGKIRQIRGLNLVFFWLVLLNIWLVVVLFIQREYSDINLYQTLKMFEFSLLFVYISYSLKSHKKLILSLYMLSIGGFVQSVIAINQFLNQHSLFESPIIQKITGEPIISSHILGAAKMTFEGEKILRAYGTFPHPNVLAGFLILTVGASCWLFLRHTIEQMSSMALISNCENIKRAKSQVSLTYFLWIVIISTQLIALLFTFSRSAWIAFIVLLLVFSGLYLIYMKNVSPAYRRPAVEAGSGRRETFSEIFNIKSLLGHIISRNLNVTKGLVAIAIIIGVVVFVYLPLINMRIGEDLIDERSYFPSNYALNDRIFYNNVSRETIYHSPMSGSGLGTYIFQINKFMKNSSFENNLLYWQYQPDHNMYFLIASEIGIIGLIIFFILIFQSIKINLSGSYYSKTNYAKIQNVSRETFLNKFPAVNMILISIIISILFISIFDHYFWTIQQGRLIFWLLLGLMVAVNRVSERSTTKGAIAD